MTDGDEDDSDRGRLQELLDRACSGDDPRINPLSLAEEEELKWLWQSEGLDLVCGPYTGHPGFAEWAFIALADRWRNDIAATPANHCPPRAADERALACLLLAVEWGASFTAMARERMERNKRAALSRHTIAWLDTLPWRLCAVAHADAAKAAPETGFLVANLTHGQSSIRMWMMELAWCAFPLLRREDVVPALFKNVADTLAGVTMAAGLATRFYDQADAFFAAARAFVPLDFEEQYRNRIGQIEKLGVDNIQASFWRLECHCRKLIEGAAFAPVSPANPAVPTYND